MLFLLLLPSHVFAQPAKPSQSFNEFLKSFEQVATQAGIHKSTYQRATKNLSIDRSIPNLVRSQPEFTTPIWTYMAKRVSKSRITRGRIAMSKNSKLFEQIKLKYGVDPAILGAIWGMETDYGAVLGHKNLIKPIIPSLATLLYQHRIRHKQDAQEFIAALRLVQDYGWSSDRLVGSWAGAIGHTQIIASALIKHRSDGDNDGEINPHTSLADALATSAKYLLFMGYKPNTDWGFEVELPKNFNYTLASRTNMKPISFFTLRGIIRVGGRKFSNLNEPVFLYIPAGKNGPKFLMTQNYLVLKSYNFSDSYALSVAHLTDRLKGSSAFIASWPTKTKFPNLEQRIIIQKKLKQLGYYKGDIDGRLGPISSQAYQSFQLKNNIVADGFITLQSYDLLKN